MKRFKNQVAGAQRFNNAPRSIGEIADRMKTNNVEPFGRGYHEWSAEQQGKEVCK